MTHSFVQVAPDSSGKKIDNVSLDGGAGDLRQRQVTAQGDPDTFGAITKVSNARPDATDYGTHVRVVPDGTPYDSGLQLLTNASALLTATTTRVDVIVLINLLDTIQEATVTNNAGTPLAYCPAVQLQPREVRVIPMYGIAAAGLKWFAKNSNAVNAQIKGLQ